MRTIYLPAIEKHVTLKAYIAAVKHAKAHPEAEFRTGLTTWWPTTGAEVVGQFRAGIHDRINDGTRYINRGG